MTRNKRESGEAALMRGKSVCLHGVVSVALLAISALGATAADDRETCAKASGDDAIAACSRVIAARKLKGAELAVIHNDRGFELKNKGSFDRAIHDFNTAIRLDAKNVSAFNNRGHAYLGKRQFERALRDFRQVVKLEPGNADGFNSLGAAYLAKGDRARAIAEFDQAIKLDPSSALYLRNRGDAHDRRQDADRAIADYTAAIKLDPNDATLLNLRGVAKAGFRHYDRAIEDYDAALKLKPDDAAALRNKADALLAKGELERALEGYELALKVNARDAGALFGRGLIRMKNGDAAGGKADLAAARRIQPFVALEFAQLGVPLPPGARPALRRPPKQEPVQQKKPTPYRPELVL
jgi:tetratricopeptide (TPR) repeat protein